MKHVLQDKKIFYKAKIIKTMWQLIRNREKRQITGHSIFPLSTIFSGESISYSINTAGTIDYNLSP